MSLRFALPIFAAAFALGCLSSATAALVITEVMSSSSHDSPTGSTANDDWFELTNTGPIALSLVGWSWDDDSRIAGTAGFGSITSIGPGESIIVTGEAASAGTEAASWRANWGIPNTVQVATLTNAGFPGLSGPNGDTIYIFDNTNAVVTFQIFGPATTGTTFEWDTSGNSLGLSVVGQNGAHKAVSNGWLVNPGPGTDIGSPGVAVAPVPEPRVVAMLTASLLVVLYGIRKKSLRG